MKKGVKIFIGVFIAILLAIVGYLVYQYMDLNSKLNDPDYLINLQSEQQTMTRERILSRLSSILLLPDEVNPKIATITNLDELIAENPEFYKNAEDGDTLVLFSELAIIYRDSINKVINIAPIVQEAE